MNEINTSSNFLVSIRVGNHIEYISMDAFAAICDKFLFEELCDLIAQSPVGTVIYSGYRNKTRYFISLIPKDVE